jgi:hypothetical protein
MTEDEWLVCSEQDEWQLELGCEIVAKIKTAGYEFPFTYGRLVDSSAFERFRKYFTDSNDWPDEDLSLEALCSEVQNRGGFLLRMMSSGVAYRGICLNHDGGQGVWFRHGDPI